MLLTFDEVSKKIAAGTTLHIAATESLLKKLPTGNWVGGSTEYFITKDGGKVSGDKLFVTEMPYDNFSFKTYDANNIHEIANDAFDNGFTIVIVPFDSVVHKKYAENAAEYENMFMRNVVGWVSGINLSIAGQTPISVCGKTGEVFSDKAVALHLEAPEGKVVSVNIVNIFEQDADAPLIEFEEEGFEITNCIVDGKKMLLSDFIKENNIDTKMPLVGEYSGMGINVSFKSIEDGVVNLYAPVFKGIKYKMAKSISCYESEFDARLKSLDTAEKAFSCNCILNFLYGELEGKNIDGFAGPITFGEIAYQLVNQTLVYVTVS